MTGYRSSELRPDRPKSGRTQSLSNPCFSSCSTERLGCVEIVVSALVVVSASRGARVEVVHAPRKIGGTSHCTAQSK